MTSQQCKASNCGEDSRYKGGSSPGGTAWPTLGGAIWPTMPGTVWPTLVDQYRANSDRKSRSSAPNGPTPANVAAAAHLSGSSAAHANAWGPPPDQPAVMNLVWPSQSRMA